MIPGWNRDNQYGYRYCLFQKGSSKQPPTITFVLLEEIQPGK